MVKNSELIRFNGKDVEVLKLNGVIVWTKNKNPETWVLNSDLTGTIGNEVSFSDIEFTADGVLFTSIKVVISGAEKLLKFDDLTPYSTSSNKWADNGYRTLNFKQAPLGELKLWLEQNGVKK